MNFFSQFSFWEQRFGCVILQFAELQSGRWWLSPHQRLQKQALNVIIFINYENYPFPFIIKLGQILS